MVSENSCHMWVFREGRSTVSGSRLQEQLRAALERVRDGNSPDARVDALLRAGEMECALADAASPGTPQASAVTDAAAAALLELPGWPALLARAASCLDEIAVPEEMVISLPEGFAYYALHPLDFAALAKAVARRGAPAAVIGIRSIGVTLSAVAMAALRGRGTRAERMTVRPVGHPYDRRTALSSEQLHWVARKRAARAQFLVVDEGPGISGSSFMSVGEALLEAGVARESIVFLGSRNPDPEKLSARDGAARWRSFRAVSPPSTAYVPAHRGEYLGGGEWRRQWYREESEWPASWVQMERLKFLSRDQRRMYKFHGLGRFGDTVAERARLIGEAGFGPRLVAHGAGFSEFEIVDGRPMEASEISAAVLERVADYCALRAVEFGVTPIPIPSCPATTGRDKGGTTQEPQLEAMVRFNVAQEFGSQPGGRLGTLHSERVVIADGRMQPHEWVRTPAGALLKTDNATHGDDHFFPGPVDIAWDLAGAVVEWGMSAEASRYLLDCYRRRSGDDAHDRMDAYLLAYSVFRMAYCAMAAFALRGSEEEPRLRHAAMHYRRWAEAQLKSKEVPFRPQPPSEYAQARMVAGPRAH